MRYWNNGIMEEWDNGTMDSRYWNSSNLPFFYPPSNNYLIMGGWVYPQ